MISHLSQFKKRVGSVNKQNNAVYGKKTGHFHAVDFLDRMY